MKGKYSQIIQQYKGQDVRWTCVESRFWLDEQQNVPLNMRGCIYLFEKYTLM